MDSHTLDRLARRYPSLNLASLRILIMIDGWEGVSMADLANELGETQQNIQFHVAMMAGGKKGREHNARHLLEKEDDPYDKRRKVLRLTEAGQRVVNRIKSI